MNTPKLCYHEPGLLAWLLQIETSDQMTRDPLLGHVYENLVVTEAPKADAAVVPDTIRSPKKLEENNAAVEATGVDTACGLVVADAGAVRSQRRRRRRRERGRKLVDSAWAPRENTKRENPLTNCQTNGLTTMLRLPGVQTG